MSIIAAGADRGGAHAFFTHHRQCVTIHRLAGARALMAGVNCIEANLADSIVLVVQYGAEADDLGIFLNDKEVISGVGLTRSFKCAACSSSAVVRAIAAIRSPTSERNDWNTGAKAAALISSIRSKSVGR